MNLKPYSAYKDSGVSWLGKVPEHWHIRKLRNILKGVSERNQSTLPLLSVVREKGVILRNMTNKDENHNFIPDDLTNYKVVREGQFVMNKMKAWQGSYGVSQYDGIVSPAYFVFFINEVDDAFFHSALRSKAYVPFFTQASDGVRIGQWDLSLDRMKEIPFLLPPLPDQTAIVCFLDYMDRKIKKYIRAKQKLIKLLEEQKQAIINDAVTGKIDVRTGKPYPKYKDSGVDWLGMVPEHWEVRRIRNIVDMRVSNIDKLTNTGEKPVRLCNYVDVYKNEHITEHLSFMLATALPDEIERFRLEIGDVLITKDSEEWNDIGVPAIVEFSACDLVCGYHLAILRPRKSELNGEFLFRSLQSPSVAYQFHVEATGVTRYGLAQGAIKSVLIPIPPLSEQAHIVAFLKKSTKELDQTTTIAKTEITLLYEYHIRLITDIVTGKVDVREATAKLPEEIKETEADEQNLDMVEEDENQDHSQAKEEDVPEAE